MLLRHNLDISMPSMAIILPSGCLGKSAVLLPSATRCWVELISQFSAVCNRAYPSASTVRRRTNLKAMSYETTAGPDSWPYSISSSGGYRPWYTNPAGRSLVTTRVSSSSTGQWWAPSHVDMPSICVSMSVRRLLT